MYITRTIEKEVKILAREFPIVTLMGPRQSGKTTLVKHLFKNYKYVSLEDTYIRQMAKNDPEGFFKKYSKKVIIDEMQKVPELFSYLQTHSDKLNKNGQFIITGSQNYLLLEKITQSLAGRVGLATLLPFSYAEIKTFDNLNNTDTLLFEGFYPRKKIQKIRTPQFYGSYIKTYVERDVRDLTNIKNFDNFVRFMTALAGRTGQILKMTELANECEISRETVKRWLNILEASFIIYNLRAYHKNYKKQMIKAPKIFFYDTGLVCHLLGIVTVEQLQNFYLKGNIFETLVVGEFIKNNFNAGSFAKFFYWRNKKGKEVDLIVENNLNIIAVEIKSSKNIRNDFFKNLLYYQKQIKNKEILKMLIYDGQENYKMQKIQILNWKEINAKSLVN